MKDFVNYIVLYSKFLDLNKGLNFLITKSCTMSRAIKEAFPSSLVPIGSEKKVKKMKM